MSNIFKGDLIERNGCFYVKVDIPQSLIAHRQVKQANVQLIDSRPLSSNQRKMCYALINAISDFTGQDTESLKDYFKIKFLTENVVELGEEIFSLSNAPMSLIAGFQRLLIKFIIENDIPVKRPLLEYVDDVRDYTYQCLIHKKCCVCGKKADLHHVDAVGMGNDRTEIIHIGMECLPLCREHHNEIHTIGKNDFITKYHLNGGIEIDNTVCRIYNIRSKK